MNNTVEAIHLLEKKLKKLLFNYKFLEKENQVLLQETTNLRHQILQKKQLLENQKKELDSLKIAKTINGSSTNTKDTKLKINTLIREIDKCITQLQK